MVAVEAGGSHRTVGNRDLPRSHHLVARHHAGHAAVTDGDQEGFFRHGRQMQHAVHRIDQRNGVTLQGSALCLLRHHIPRHLRRFAQQDIKWHIDRLITEMTIFQAQVQLFRSFTNDRERCAFALANCLKLRQLIGCHCHHITFL